jgi:hypothetical protein
MDVLPRIFFKMQSRNRDLFRSPFERMAGVIAHGCHDLKDAIRGERLIVL